MVLVALLTLAAAAVSTVAAPSSLPRRAATVYSACTKPNMVALTFVSLEPLTWSNNI